MLRTPVEKAAYLRTLQEYTISPQLRQVANVAGVDAIGGYAKQYGVEPDPMKLVGYGLSFSDLIDALEAGNVAQGAKYIETAGEALQVRASGLLTGVEDIAGIVIGESDGVPGPRVRRRRPSASAARSATARPASTARRR